MFSYVSYELMFSFLPFFFYFLRFLLYESNELDLEERCHSDLSLVGKMDVEEIDNKDELWYLVFLNLRVLHLPLTSLFLNLLDFLGTQAA